MSADEHFHCTVLHCTLSRQSCADRHARAEIAAEGDRRHPWVQLRVCAGCPVGQEHNALFPAALPETPPARHWVQYVPEEIFHTGQHGTRAAWFQTPMDGQPGDSLIHAVRRKRALDIPKEVEGESLSKGAFWLNGTRMPKIPYPSCIEEWLFYIRRQQRLRYYDTRQLLRLETPPRPVKEEEKPLVLDLTPLPLVNKQLVLEILGYRGNDYHGLVNSEMDFIRGAAHNSLWPSIVRFWLKSNTRAAAYQTELETRRDNNKSKTILVFALLPSVLIGRIVWPTGSHPVFERLSRDNRAILFEGAWSGKSHTPIRVTTGGHCGNCKKLLEDQRSGIRFGFCSRCSGSYGHPAPPALISVQPSPSTLPASEEATALQELAALCASPALSRTHSEDPRASSSTA